MLKMIPDNVQKSLKSDAQDFEKSSKTIYYRQFSWFPHMYTRCENRVETKIEAKTTPNPLKNDTNFEPKNKCNKKQHKNGVETTMCRKVFEKSLKKEAQERRF